jgi:hypothetical protein
MPHGQFHGISEVYLFTGGYPRSMTDRIEAPVVATQQVRSDR